MYFCTGGEGSKGRLDKRYRVHHVSWLITHCPLGLCESPFSSFIFIFSFIHRTHSHSPSPTVIILIHLITSFLNSMCSYKANTILQCKKAKWLSEETLQIALKRREVKSKGEKERCTHLNAEFQRIARRDKKAFLDDQCKEREQNNRMGKTRD